MDFTSERDIDDVGRFVLPIDIRKFYGFYEGASVKVISNSSDIIISKTNTNEKHTRKVDRLGRIVIPKKIRTKFDIIGKTNVLVVPR